MHITFSRTAFGPDVPASVTPEELARLVSGVRQVCVARETNPEKAEIARRTGALKDIFGRSLALREDMTAGIRIEEHHLVLKKPAGGIPWSSRGEVVGRTLARDKSARRLLQPEDLE